MIDTEHPGGQRAIPMVELKRYPNLRLLAWQLHQDWMPEDEAFSLYEREWRHVDTANLTADEQALIEHLTACYGQGVMNV
jgi:hypothetical protein